MKAGEGNADIELHPCLAFALVADDAGMDIPKHNIAAASPSDTNSILVTRENLIYLLLEIREGDQM